MVDVIVWVGDKYLGFWLGGSWRLIARSTKFIIAETSMTDGTGATAETITAKVKETRCTAEDGLGGVRKVART